MGLNVVIVYQYYINPVIELPLPFKILFNTK